MKRQLIAIWPDGKLREKNYHCAFLLHAVDLGKNSVLRLAGENQYRVQVNGHFVGAGPVRCAHGKSEIDTFSLDEYLDGQGNAWICVEMTGYNIYVLSDANDPPFFAAEVLTGKTVRYTSTDFSAYECSDALRIVPRYSWQRHFLECYRMKSDRRSFYMGDVTGMRCLDCIEVKANKLSERSVSYPEYDVAYTEKVVSVGTVTADPYAPEYRERYLYDIEDNGFVYDTIRDSAIEAVRCFTYNTVQNGEAISVTPRFTLYDLGCDHSGFIKLTLSAHKPSKVYVLWDEVLNEKGHINPLRMRMANVLRLELSEGEFDFESMEPYTMRYMKVIVTEGSITVNKIGVRNYENPDVSRLRFTCEDTRYSELMMAAQRTLAQNSTDILMDCPSRERAGWLCDSFFMGYAEHLLGGENKVERHFLMNYVDCPQFSFFPKGMIPKSYPCEVPISKTFIPNWAMWYILELKAYFDRTGDRKLIDKSKKVVDGLISYFEKFENELELLEDLENWVFVEWSRANDFVDGVNFPSNMLYSGALDAVAALYDRPLLAEKAERIRKNVRALSLGNGLFYRDHAIRKDSKLCVMPDRTETCQYYAFYFGVATPKDDPGLLEELLCRFGYYRDNEKVYPDVYKSNAFIGNLMRLEYLSENGYEAEALSQVVDFYYYMVQKTGTLWEYDTPKKSCCHGFASYISLLILRGTVGFDARFGNTLVFLDRHSSLDCEVSIPVSASEYVTVTVKDGKRTVTTPEGFEIRIRTTEKREEKEALKKDDQADIMYDGAKVFTPFRSFSRGAKTAIVNEMTREDFGAYCEELAAKGFVKTSENAFGDNLFTGFDSDKYSVYASFREYSGEMYITVEAPRSLPRTDVGEGSIRFAQYDTVNSYCDAVTGVACGMGYLFLLPDNSFIAIDGGNDNDCDGFVGLMKEMSGEERPRVNLWIITHPHGDHYDALKYISQADTVDIENYYTCMPPDNFKPRGTADMLRSIRGYDQKNIPAHTGDRFVFGALCMETLLTCEDMLIEEYEKTYKDTNNLSLILRFTVADQSILFAADARTAEYSVLHKVAEPRLRSDILQVSHHGRTGAAQEDMFVYSVSPKVALWPGNHAQIAYSNSYGSNNWIRSGESTVTESFVANDGKVVWELPYKINEKN